MGYVVSLFKHKTAAVQNHWYDIFESPSKLVS